MANNDLGGYMPKGIPGTAWDAFDKLANRKGVPQNYPVFSSDTDAIPFRGGYTLLKPQGRSFPRLPQPPITGSPYPGVPR